MFIPENEILFSESKIFPALRDENDNVVAFVESALEDHDCPMKAMMKIDVAVEEMFINIASYAYAQAAAPTAGTAAPAPEAAPGTTFPAPEAVAEVTVTVSASAAEVTLADSGIPFDPLAKPDPDTTLPAEQRAIGGLGIFMVKKSMDRVHYKREDGKNIFTMLMKF